MQSKEAKTIAWLEEFAEECADNGHNPKRFKVYPEHKNLTLIGYGISHKLFPVTQKILDKIAELWPNLKSQVEATQPLE